MKEKQIQIPETLWNDIVVFMLAESQRDKDRYNRIERGILDKIERMIEHELYTKFKTAPSDQEREKARQEYLDKKGIPKSFRW